MESLRLQRALRIKAASPKVLRANRHLFFEADSLLLAGVGPADSNVVVEVPVEALPRFESAGETQVVIDFVIGGAVVEVNIPAEVAMHTVIPDAC